MIAPGTRVLFTDRTEGPREPHDGQTGTIRAMEENSYTLIFDDGQIVWADPYELSAA